MTKAPRAPGASQTTKKNKPPVQGATAVAQALEVFALLPLHALAEGRNQSCRSLLQELTGLSKARIAKGHLDVVRPSTQQKIERHLQDWLEKELDDPDALARHREKVATSPSTRSGRHAPWAGWIQIFEFLPLLPLPISKAVALQVDDLVEVLLTACRANDLPSFKQTWLDHLEYHGLAVRIPDEPFALPVPLVELEMFQAMESWEDADRLTRRAVDHLYLDVIAALDVEWSSHYFCGGQSMPIFPLVMVRPQDGLLETGKAASSKNVIYLPSRRLLEFLYALVFNIRYKKWPAKPPSPKELAHTLDNPSQDVAFAASTVSNHFDGSLKLTLDLTLDYWSQLYQHFLPGKKLCERAAPPLPMIMLALQWQALLVQDQGRSFILLDLEAYSTFWRHRRQQWDPHQSAQEEDWPTSGHPRRDPIKWPAWMLSQSSSPSA